MLAFMSPFQWKKSMETLCRTFKFLKAMQNIDPGWNLSWVPNASLANKPGGWGVCPWPLWVFPYHGAAAIWARNDGIPSGSSERRPSGSRAKSRDDGPELASHQPQGLGSTETNHLITAFGAASNQCSLGCIHLSFRQDTEHPVFFTTLNN